MSLAIYLVRHGEVEHHRTDVSLTPRGQAQAEAAGALLATRVAASDSVAIRYSPVTRVKETAELLHGSLSSALAAAGGVIFSPLQPDEALSNVRFILNPGEPPNEPSLLHAQTNSPAFLQSVSPARADFYRGFWASRDPMGYWLTRDSAGAAETLEIVWARVCERVRGLLDEHGQGLERRTHWIGVTHSGALRVVLRHAFGADPGEPDFCSFVVIEPDGPRNRLTLSYQGRRTPLELAEC
ncbi:MAG: histidine phosphatase family protein [Chloroflexi bacterium]|nr:histidine phosphatase family protein [Chloroflexota bacterium]